MNELNTFLGENSALRFIDVLPPDLFNAMRGKRLPRDDFCKIYDGRFRAPSSIMLLDVTGESGDPWCHGFSDDDADVLVKPTPGVLQRIS
jgi:hypothetical protein